MAQAIIMARASPSHQNFNTLLWTHRTEGSGVGDLHETLPTRGRGGQWPAPANQQPQTKPGATTNTDQTNPTPTTNTGQTNTTPTANTDKPSQVHQQAWDKPTHRIVRKHGASQPKSKPRGRGEGGGGEGGIIKCGYGPVVWGKP